MQAADGDNGPSGRAGCQRRMVLVTFAEPGQEARDVLGTDLLDLGPPGRSQGRGVTTQVTPVSLQRVLGEAALYRQVVEITPDSSGEGGQLSTSARLTTGR
jgi:hypothetical protein